MGLLDSVFGTGMDDPKMQGIMGLAGGLLANSGYSNQPVSTGQSIGQGLQNYQQGYAQAQQSQQMQAIKKMQLEKYQQEQQRQAARQEAMKGVEFQSPFAKALAEAGDISGAVSLENAQQKNMQAGTKAPQRNTYRQGDKEITQEWDANAGAWKTIGEGDQWRPPAIQDPNRGWQIKERPDGSMVRVNALTGEMVPVEGGSGPVSKPVKPMPASLQKLEAEDIDAIQTGGAISADIASLKNQIDAGAIKLGPVENRLSEAKNWVGASDQSSRNYASMQNTLEKMRNDSLRLNKGVQTEGDATRAWNELFKSINDEAVVSQRLAEIQAINERAAGLRLEAVNFRRRNNNLDPIDDESLFAVKPVVGQGGGATPARTPSPAAAPKNAIDATTLKNYALKHGIPVAQAAQFLQSQGYEVNQ